MARWEPVIPRGSLMSLCALWKRLQQLLSDCGLMKIRHSTYRLATVVLGLAVSSAHPAGIVAAFLLLPAFTFWQSSRRSCYGAATGYYAGALWPIGVGAKNFFGPDVSVSGAMAFWAVCAVLLALPYALLWTDRIRQLLWRPPVALMIGI